MLDQEIDTVLGTIEDFKNPEIHHYHRGSHPGLGWYIKTVVPGPDAVNDDTHVLLRFWMQLQKTHPEHVRLVKSSYDWDGAPIPGWWTIWLADDVDVIWSWSRESGFDHRMVTYDDGLRNSAGLLREWLDRRRNRHLSENQVSCDRVQEISEFLRTFTSETRCQLNRSKLRVISHDEVFPETPDGDQLGSPGRR